MGLSYSTTRARLLELATSLSIDDGARLVPALPGWTVKDAYAHLSGVCGDVLDERMDGAGTPAWTARQVSERRDESLGAVCDEWALRGPRLDAWIGDAGEVRSTFVAIDVWHHEQDVRDALGLRGVRGDERVTYLASRARAAFDRRFRDAAAPALCIVNGEDETVLGDGEAIVTLRVDDYELLRILSGRRCLDQILHAEWSGDPTPYLEHLHLFPLPVGDLTD